MGDTAQSLIYAEPGDTVRALRSLIPLVADDAPRRWVHVIYEGEWKGHPAGEFQVTRQALSEAVRNFASQRNPLPLDTEHTSETSDYAPAVGWVHDLEVREGKGAVAHLWALVEFGEQAATDIKAGRYRFNSAVLDFDARDRKTGEAIGCRMRSLALTNQPFIDGQEPIALTDRLLAEGGPMEFSRDALANALEQIEGDAITMAQLEAAAHMAAAADGKLDDEPDSAPMADEDPAPDEPADLADESDEPAELADVGDGGPDEEEQAPTALQDDAATMLMARLTEALGLDEAGVLAALEENLDGVIKALGGGESSAAVTPLSESEAQITLRVLTDRTTTLEADLAARDAELTTYRTREAEAEVNALVQAGRLLDDRRADMVALKLESPDVFTRVLGALPQVVPVDKMPPPPPKSAPVDEATIEIDEKDPEIRKLRDFMAAAGMRGRVVDDACRRVMAQRARG